MEERQTSMQWVPGVPGGREGHWDRRPAAGASFVDPSGWAQQPAQAARRPATRPGSRPSAGAAQQGWYASGGIAYRSSDNKRLGRIVPGSHYQVAEETNGGKLWSVGTLHADGKVSDWKPYGSVPGLPPPSNAQQPEQYAQPSRRPAYAPAPAPQYVYPSPQPVYASPLPTPVAAAPAYYGSPLPTPVYAQPPVYASPLPPQDGAPYGLDPFTGQPLTAAQASVYAQYGAQSAAAQFTQGQQAAGQLDQLTMSIMMGGGATDDGYGGMIGGMDASTLAMLSGGDADLALQMALANGGYDPTAGEAFLNPIPGQG